LQVHNRTKSSETLYIETIKYKFKRMRAMENEIKIKAELGIRDEQGWG